ncbi:MAG: GxxExxY protein [Gemmatimonadaceae bacterium]
MGNLLEEDRTGSVLAAFFEVYGALGYGFLEHVYELAMERELRARGHQVSRQVAVRVRYKGADLATQRLDMLVDDRVILEFKSTAELPLAAKRQLHNYLRATSLEVGPLLHFGPRPRFHRLVSTNTRPFNP